MSPNGIQIIFINNDNLKGRINMLKPYPKYKDSGVSWIGMVPQGWEVSSVGRLYSAFLGKMLEQNSNQNQRDSIEKPYICAKDVHFDGVDITDSKLMKFNKQEIQKYSVKRGDLLIVEGGAGAGGSAIYNYDDERMVQNSIHVVRSRGFLLNRYLYYWMYSLVSRDYIDAVCNKATIPHFTGEKLAATMIPLPPRPEQDAIVAYLDDKTAKIDRLIGLYKREIELLKERRQAAIHQAVTRGLDDKVKLKDSGVSWIGMVPVGWERLRLRFICKIKTGDQDTQDAKEDGEFPFYVRSPIVERTNRYTFFGEGIIIAGDGAGAGRVFHHAFGKYGVHQRCYRLSDFVYLNTNYLFYYISNLYPNVMDLGSAQSTVPSIRLHMLQNFPVFYPPRPEQDAIVAYLDDQCAKVDAMIGKVQSKIGLLEEYRVRLISDVVTGKVRV